MMTHQLNNFKDLLGQTFSDQLTKLINSVERQVHISFQSTLVDQLNLTYENAP